MHHAMKTDVGDHWIGGLVDHSQRENFDEEKNVLSLPGIEP
jgi:hypothetical protein